MVLFTHAHDAAEHSPILALESPEKRCGKTTTLSLVVDLVPRRLPAANVSPAALFRAVEKYRPTLLIDEGDSFLRGENQEMRGILAQFKLQRRSISGGCETLEKARISGLGGGRGAYRGAPAETDDQNGHDIHLSGDPDDIIEVRI